VKKRGQVNYLVCGPTVEGARRMEFIFSKKGGDADRQGVGSECARGQTIGSVTDPQEQKKYGGRREKREGRTES